jgi:hypothetical protein
MKTRCDWCVLRRIMLLGTMLDASCVDQIDFAPFITMTLLDQLRQKADQ